MLFDQITPFVRFAAKQNMSNDYLYSGKEIVGYDHRIYYVLSGHGTLYVGSETYDLQPYSFVMWQSGTPYCYYSNKNDPLICITCNFDFTLAGTDKRIPVKPSITKEFRPEQTIEGNIVFSDLPPFNHTVFFNNLISLRSLMEKLEDTYTKKQRFYSLRCNNILQEILIRLSYKTDESLNKNSNLLENIISYIHDHFRENPTNEEIGDFFKYHPNYINSLLVKHTGMSLHKYVLNYKLNYAAQLLLTTDKSITEVADEINIPDSQYFSRLFKKYYQQTPSQYRLNK